MKKYYCIDCGKQLSNYKHKRCKSCSKKGRLNPSFKENAKNKQNYYCIDCGKEISYGAERCKSCANRGEQNPCFIKNKPIYYCIDCGKEISKNAKRCYSCNNKYNAKLLKNKHKLDCQCFICKAKRGECKGEKHSFFGKHHTKETIEKMSLVAGGTGIPYENRVHPKEFTNELKEQIRFRDNYICQICGLTTIENGKQLPVHHIDYNKKNNAEDNLIALCVSCHTKTNFNRDYWRNYFNGKNKYCI